MAARKGRWIALGIAGFVILAGGFCIGFIVYTVTRNLEIRPAASMELGRAGFEPG